MNKNFLQLYNNISELSSNNISTNQNQIVNNLLTELIRYQKEINICKEQEYTKRHCARMQKEAIIDYNKNKREIIKEELNENRTIVDKLISEAITILQKGNLSDDDKTRLAYILSFYSNSNPTNLLQYL